MTNPTLLTADGTRFVTDRHLATLSTLARGGGIHTVAVGFTFDGRILRIITSGPSQKVLNVRRGGTASVGQVDGGRWISFSGPTEILEDAASVADAVERYAARYRQPQPNPLRVVIAMTVTTVLGSAGLVERRVPDGRAGAL
ncbi:MAG: pyridoxamine 5'-phosphate oxidase family protein [Leifsonia sp.]